MVFLVALSEKARHFAEEWVIKPGIS